MIWNMILNKLKKQTNITKNELECKENEYKQLESFASEKLEEIEILRDNNQSMISQISENVRMEKKISIQNKIISELKDNLGEKHEFQNNQEDILNLVDDIKHLKEINEEKEFQLENISREHAELKFKLASMETDQEKSLEDELGLQVGKIFKCGECDS